MKNRFSRMGKTLLGAVCLLSMGGMTYSCTDDYDLDETMPSYLGGSIYDELKARNFTTVVRLIEDLGYKEVLAKTGSKTLFVADDDAYGRFFENNTSWLDASGNPVKSYDQLSLSQKRWLLNGAMLNSAYVLEMLSNHGKDKNMCLRQMSASSAVDSIRYWKWDELPENLNEGETDEEGNVIGDKKFWDKYRDPAKKGIYMATDKTSPMMTHFLEGQMKEKKITRGDVAFILNDRNGWAEDAEDRSYIYGSKIIKQDVTCLNGYFHVLDSVLVTPNNMAEIIRTNGSTDLFSCMLERFSAPYYDADLTQNFQSLYGKDITDSVFQKRYLSERSIGNSKISLDPDKKSLGSFPYLPFDPGWNELTSSETVVKERDMGAMFVPTDQAMIEYFVNGAGKVLMDRYAKRENTVENLKYNLYQIPLDIIEALIGNLMKDSFLETVPSKYLTIMNDAQDQMFPASTPSYATLDQYKSCFDRCLLANNGVVYVMNHVVSPADYASVIAPALFSKNTQVVKTVARADDAYIQGSSYNNAPLKKYYSTYLKAMQSRFSFFVPTDEGLGLYGIVDPMSLAKGNSPKAQEGWKYWRFAYKNAPQSQLAIRAEAFKYNIATGQQEDDVKSIAGGSNLNVSEPVQGLGSGAGLIKKFLMIDMMDQHIVVHENDDTEGVNSERKYYTSRGGAPVIVLDKGNKEENGKGMAVNGGFQYQLNHDSLESNDHNCLVVEGYDMTREKNNYGNGMTYLLDRPMQPTTRSFYNVMRSDAEHYSEFFSLSQSQFSADLLELVGLRKAEWTDDKDKNWVAEQNKYRIFTNASGYFAAQDEMLIRFFNNYRYTVYVPTNEAMQEAYGLGLPSFQAIEDFVETHKYKVEGQEDGEDAKYTMAPEDQRTAQAMITMLVNFVKYHFQDQAFYVDNVEAEGEFQTSCVDVVNNIYLPIKMKQTPGNISVTDEAGNTQDVIAPYNVLARDANFDKSVASTATSISNGSFVVVHQVSKPLNFKSLENGRYDSDWSSDAKAKAFLEKYRILK